MYNIIMTSREEIPALTDEYEKEYDIQRTWRK